MNEPTNHPLGEPVNRPEPTSGDVWLPVPDKPWLERNAQGQLRTKLPDPFNNGIWPFPTGAP